MAKTSTKSQSKASSPLVTKKKAITKSKGKTLKLASPKKAPSNVIVKTISVYKDQKDFFKMNDHIMSK